MIVAFWKGERDDSDDSKDGCVGIARHNSSAGQHPVTGELAAEKGVVDWARHIRAEYLTGTAVTIIVVLLILLVSPRGGAKCLVRRYPVCDHVLVGRGGYCSECGSKVS